MEFTKILIQKNEGAISGAIAGLQTQKAYFQNYINKLIETGIHPKEEDLKLLFENPKEYITSRLIERENPTFEGFRVQKDKLFELMEKPVGTVEIINAIEKDLQTSNIREFHIWRVNHFFIVNNLVELKPHFIEEIENMHSIFLTNENQKNIYNNLLNIAELLNEINNLGGDKISINDTLESLFITDEKQLKVNASIIKRFE